MNGRKARRGRGRAPPPLFCDQRGAFALGKFNALHLKYGQFAALLTSRQRSNAQVTPIPMGHLDGRARTRADRVWSKARFLALVRRLTAEGAPSDGRTFHWSLSGRSKWPCIDPQFVYTATAGQYDQTGPLQNAGPRGIGSVHIFGRCRKCEMCAKFKRNSWIARTIVEAKATPGRMWFTTLNSDPAHRAYIDQLATIEAGREKKLFVGLTEAEKFPYRAIILKREVVLYNKRLRKGYGPKGRCRFRFLCIVEPHKDDHAHAHILFHETSGAPLTERLFRARWRGRGMARANLVQGADRVAQYVSKYITKDFGGTVHASIRYGESSVVRP